jgi:Predicted metal-binding protein related to the C-terminal domain of SecA
MKDEKLGELLEAFANFYWSVPVKFATKKIMEWHPEVTAKQISKVLDRCDEAPYWLHCCVVTDVVDEPEIVAEHLVAIDENDLDRFLAARLDASYCDNDEETLFQFKEDQLDIPEVNAIIEFGKTELGLDGEWAEQLLHDSILFQPLALCEKESWVMSVLHSEQYGKIHFRTIEQVERFRTLGNSLYRVLPNPVLRGWRPVDIDDPPVLPDEIPEKDEDIPDGRPVMDEFLANIERFDKANQIIMQPPAETAQKRKIGRNDPCPCGSGKKYKKCCGRLPDNDL